MRLVDEPDELEGAFQTAAAEAEAAFGDPGLYLEKAIVPARHVEIQVLADGAGGVLTLGERECSIQRRHQKLIEESPSPALDAETREQMEDAAERAARAVDYRNAGTFEFLLGAGRLVLLHRAERAAPGRASGQRARDRHRPRPEQLRIAAGERLSATGRAERRGHAIEIRINAEDPARDFLPVPGRIERFRAAARARGARRHARRGRRRRPAELRLAAREGDRVGLGPARGDRPRPARARASSRSSACRRPPAAALDILRTEEFASGRYSTGFLEEAGSALARARRLMSGRRAARRTALFLLYQWDVTGQPLASLYEGEIDPFARELAEAVVARAAELDEKISDASEELDGRPARRARAQRAAHRSARARAGRRPGRGRDRRGGLAREALRVRRGGQARERDPRPGRQGEGAHERGRGLAEAGRGAARAARGRRVRASRRRTTPRRRSTSSASSPRSRRQVEAELEQARREAECSVEPRRAPRARRGLPRRAAVRRGARRADARRCATASRAAASGSGPCSASRAARRRAPSRRSSCPAAAAIELVHTFGMVHDDLPALDDDDVRRGRADLARPVRRGDGDPERRRLARPGVRARALVPDAGRRARARAGDARDDRRPVRRHPGRRRRPREAALR